MILSESIIENLDNQILVNNLPMKINTLIEKINMSFLKKNYNTQSEILIKNYKIDLNSRIMWKEDKSVNLTEKETLAILYLNKKDKPCSIDELQKVVWKQSTDLETHTVETHIYRLRKK